MKISRNVILIIIIALVVAGILFVALYPLDQVKLEVIAKDRPDIMVEAFSYGPAEPQTGGNVVFNGVIKNSGELPAENIVIVMDFGNGEQELLNVPESLASGAIYNFNFTQVYLLSGTYTARVNATTDNDAEQDNNIYELIIVVTQTENQTYDLTVSDISWLPEHPATGNAVTFTINIENIGNAPSPAAQAVFDAGASTHSFTVPELLPSQAGIEEATFVFDTAGDYNAYAEVFADDENIYNNFRNESFSVISDAYPTIAVSHVPEENITTDTRVFITATGNDDIGLTAIEIYVDSIRKKTCSVGSTSASCTFNSTFYNGTHSYYGKVTDTAYHETSSGVRNFTVSGNISDTLPETNVSFSPEQITTTTPVTLSASATDNTDLKKIEIYVDDVVIATCTYPSIETSGECIYKSVFTAGTHQLYSEVTDNLNNIVRSATAQFTVS